MATTRIASDLVVTGNLNATSMTLPSGSVTNSTVAAGAAIDAAKVEHLVKAKTDFGVDFDGTPATDEAIVYVATGAATIRRFSAVLIETGTSSSDISFDLKKASSGSKTFTTVLSGTVDFDFNDTDNTVQTGSLSATTLAAGDVLRIDITATDTTGVQGPFAWVEIDEVAT